jgi:hypothetical protein
MPDEYLAVARSALQYRVSPQGSAWIAAELKKRNRPLSLLRGRDHFDLYQYVRSDELLDNGKH